MNDVIWILLLLSVVSLEAAELDERASSTYRRHQRDEDEFESVFLAQVSALALENGTAEDFAAFVDAMAADASLRNDNRSSDSNMFEDSDSDFTTALSSASNDENISFDQDVGSSFSSNGELDFEIDSDANLAGGNLPIGLATVQNTSNFLILLTIGLILEMATSLQQ